jgi:hypothetical protein
MEINMAKDQTHVPHPEFQIIIRLAPQNGSESTIAGLQCCTPA